jgi:hypothetical protein
MAKEKPFLEDRNGGIRCTDYYNGSQPDSRLLVVHINDPFWSLMRSTLCWLVGSVVEFDTRPIQRTDDLSRDRESCSQHARKGEYPLLQRQLAMSLPWPDGNTGP